MLLISSTNRPLSKSQQVSQLYLSRFNELQPHLHADFLGFEKLSISSAFQNMYNQKNEILLNYENLVSQHQKIIFILPEYNGSFPGILKLWIDALTYGIFAGKKAALVGLSAGMFGNARGLDHFCEVLNYLQVLVLPYRLHIPFTDKHNFDKHSTVDGNLINQIDHQIKTFSLM